MQTGSPRLVQFTVQVMPDTVRRAIAEQVRPVKWFSFAWPGPPFMGRETADGFLVHQVIQGHNSFNATIRIRIRPNEYGTLVTAGFRLNAAVLAVIAVWFLLLLQFLSVAIHLAVTEGEFAPLPVLLSFGLFCGGLTWWGVKRSFPASAASGEDLLRGILEPLNEPD